MAHHYEGTVRGDDKPGILSVELSNSTWTQESSVVTSWRSP